ncbi:MAG: hypothetical protein MPW14_24840 (plasmid) [Candidatus Manganitrophus sp.]|nr:MAG: hypothetical protein MPW17_21620 [Candidatus Manganitrophus sp.]WDT82845.1 MAG: hypothetical protein MPW14_24840 [Candidatus Manganitrophus sp.]
MSRNRIVMVVSGFPRRSETFMLNELLALDERGLLGAIFATKGETDLLFTRIATEFSTKSGFFRREVRFSRPRR